MRAIRKGRALRIVALCLGAAGLLLVSTVLLRHTIATAVADSQMKHRGLLCDDITAEVPFAIPPDEVRIAPTRCTMAEGPLHSIRFNTPVVVDLDGLKPGSVVAQSVDINLRRRAHRDVDLNVMGDLMSIGGLDEPIVGLIFDATSIPSYDLPPVFSQRMSVTRAGQPLVTARDVRLVADQGGTRITARSARLEGGSDLLGNARLNLWVNAHRAQGIVVFPSGLRGSVKAAQLAGPRPEFNFAIGDAQEPRAGR